MRRSRSKAGVCVRTVATALQRLRELGILNWVRRCAESWRDGRFVLAQDTNAYGLLPESQWRGYRPPQEQPAPAPGTWGDPAPMPSVLAQAALEGREEGDLRSVRPDTRRRSQGPAGSGAGAPRSGVPGAQLVSFTEMQLVGETSQTQETPERHGRRTAQPDHRQKEGASNKWPPGGTVPHPGARAATDYHPAQQGRGPVPADHADLSGKFCTRAEQGVQNMHCMAMLRPTADRL